MFGVLADTHDNLRAIDYWVRRLQLAGASAIIHAGDFIAPFTIEGLAAFEGPVYGVFGNNDGDRSTLLSKAEGTDVRLEEPPATFDCDELRVTVTHKPSVLPDSTGPDIDLLIHGHTHQPRWESHVPMLNPGEAGGWVTGVSHAALVRTDPLDVSFHTVPAP